ncbi:hypothetical protein Cgig2_001319 [Carnegiea gigantea]|uniref:Protein ECERIFERUM 26-like n=1 Tax=Carnegiea gigantea TaxID=171969 RepID=A0A9Q1KU93_9CARY|nr:hypothetical protein Cgig2_001319 [Carnegiea gigantea]
MWLTSVSSQTYEANGIHSNDSDEKNEALIYGKRLSSVGPARVTGDLMYEPSNMDLAMKLHYLRVVYLFEVEAMEVLTMPRFKEAIFEWLCYYYESCGRLRREDTHGRPYIKCNDCGIRFVEVKSSKTLQEWLQLGDHSLQHRLLVPDHVVGPELAFSPLVFIQMTALKCGGLAVGLSWAHILGDAFSVAEFMNLCGQFLKGLEATYPANLNKSPPNNAHKPSKPSSTLGSGPLSLKQVSPVGDHWTFPTPCDMATFSFHVTATQLAQLSTKTGPFAALSAAVWRAIAKVRCGPEPNTITVVTRGVANGKAEDSLLRNNQVVSSVEAHFHVATAHIDDLAMLIHNEAQDERAQIEEVVGQNPGGSDFIIYGSNPTFVDIGGADFYGFEVKGMKPRLVNCFVDGIGGGGVVLVLPSPKSGDHEVDDNNGKIGDEGRIVTLILPKVYMEELKKELKEEWSLIA